MLKGERDVQPVESTSAQSMATPGDPRAALVRQVLSSRTFSKSVRLSQFLDFVCSRTLAGRTHEINEQQIGIHVFGRSPAYSATDDSIVRTQARLLRQRLEEYFEHECPHCALILAIPRGGYVPVFERRHEAVPPSSAEAAVGAGGAESPTVATPKPERTAVGRSSAFRRFRRGRYLIWSAGLLAVVAVGSLFLQRHPAGGDGASVLLRAIFASGRPVVIVPSDDGLVLTEELRRAPVSLDEYLSGSYLRPEQGSGAGGSGAGGSAAGNAGTEGPITADWLSAHQYTSTADLALAMRLNRLPEAASASVETRYARVLRLDDLKSSNVILIGGVCANPWVSLFVPVLNFDVNYDFKTHIGYVLNKNPHPGELREYREHQTGEAATSYGVVAFVPGIGGEGNALLFEGSGMAGTEAAADFPFSGERFHRFLTEIGSRPGGRVPYFEVLLETESLAGNGPAAHVLAWRTIPR